MTSVAQIQWFGGDQPERRFPHTLKVRRADQWTEFRWSEPLDAKSESEKALAAAARRIRALVQGNLTDSRARPICL